MLKSGYLGYLGYVLAKLLGWPLRENPPDYIPSKDPV